MCFSVTNKEATDLMIRIAVSTALAGLIALSVAGCAVEVPMKAFRMAPPDATLKDDARPRPDVKHLSID